MMKINALSALASAESDVLRYALGFPNAASAAPDGTKDSLADPCVAVSSAEGTA